MKRIIFYTCIFLIGCTTNPDIGSLSSTQRAKLATLKVYKASLPFSEKYKILGTVKGLSCHRSAYKPVQMLSEDEAIQGIKISAAKLGADAVINTFCQNNSGTDFANNCWASIVCAGDAITYTN